VQESGSFTADLHRIAQWLKACKVETVAPASDRSAELAGLAAREAVTRDAMRYQRAAHRPADIGLPILPEG
jgi:hypothetical protein